MKDLEKLLSKGGLSAHDLEKTKKKLEMEKEELNAALGEAENQLESEETCVLYLQLELTQLKEDTRCQLAEKDEEIEAQRKFFQHQLDAMQQNLDGETKAKNKQTR